MTERSGLAPDELERLAFLAEECGEIVQAIGKIQRHGYDNTNPDDPRGGTNRERLAKEIGDAQFAISMVLASRDVDARTVIRVERERTAGEGRGWLRHQEPGPFERMREAWNEEP